MLNLEGKTALITGAARGIGKSIACKLAAQGVNIVLNDIPGSDAAATCEELKAMGVGCICTLGDVRSEEDAKRAVADGVEAFGGIDILVNNAGITRDGLAMRMSEADWDDVLAINLKGAFHMMKAVCKPMFKQRSGSIINVASVVGIMGNAGQANYSASKGGLIALTKTIAKEYAPRNIRVNAVAPGFIRSAMTDKLTDEVRDAYFKAIPLGRFGEPEDVADVVAFLASDMAKYITGQVVQIDGGLLM